MASVNQKTFSFETVAESIKKITDTKNTFHIDVSNQEIVDKICTINNYSSYGFKSLGKAIGFPPQFITEISKTNEPLANKIIKNRIINYYNNKETELYAREFSYENEKPYIYGVVTNKYAYFDDDEVIDIVGNSSLAEFQFQYALATPERLHLRAIDLNNPFKVEGDNSNLFMMYFIDNSMVGQSAFKIRVGIYRQVCSNGMIVPVQSFTLCRAVHRGHKDIVAEFKQNFDCLAEKTEQIKSLISKASAETATINELQIDFRKTYVTKELNLNRREAEKVINLFNNYSMDYGKPSKWAFINAVTQFARDLPNTAIDKRLYLESKALKAA